MARITATGYVHNMLDNNLDSSQFIMECARAFGALYSLRDDPQGSKIPEEFQVSDYSLVHRQEAEAKWKELMNMSVEQRKECGRKARQEKIDYYIDAKEAIEKEIERIHEMHKRVMAWEPPTPEHQELKKFAIGQLTDSLRGANPDWYEKQANEAIAQDPIDFFNEIIALAKKNIGYYMDEYEKEKQRVANQNKWLKDLRESLK